MYTILSFECFNPLDYCQRFLGLKYIHVIIHSINVERYRHQIWLFFSFPFIIQVSGYDASTFAILWQDTILKRVCF